MELDYFWDLLFDHINEWDLDVLEILENHGDKTLWVVVRDGSVFRIQCEKETFHLFKPPQ